MNLFNKFFKRKKHMQPEQPEPNDSLGYLSHFYSNYDEDNRLLRPHGQVEYLTTMRYIERYLVPGMRVLEIGAATGRYSLALARKGYNVTAIELVQHNIDVFRSKLKPEDKVDLQQGDALDLSRFADNSFDMTLLLGPMYHLYTREDQLRALNEALRVTKPGGYLYVAYVLSDMAIMVNGIQNKHWLWRYLDNGQVTRDNFVFTSKPSDLFQLYRKEDIFALAGGLPAERLHYVGVDCAAELVKDALAAMAPEQFAIFMDYHYFLCERPDMAGMANHSLDILRKI